MLTLYLLLQEFFILKMISDYKNLKVVIIVVGELGNQNKFEVEGTL